MTMSLASAADRLAPGVDAAIPTDFVCRFSVEQYHHMLRAGILREDDPLELLDGWLVPKMMKNPPHRVVTELVRKAFERIVPSGWFVSSQDPVTLAASEPEPDVAVIRGQLRDYLQRHPGPHEVALVVEVADVSLELDQTTKKRLYAQAGIPFYWIVNLRDRRVEVYSEPSETSDYQRRRDFADAATIPVVIGEITVGEIAASDILP
jgi:Uma2 family endonuclease